MQLLWIGLTACRSAFSIFIISALGRTVKSVLGAFAIYFRLIKCNMCSKVCSQKAKERKNQRSYALSFGAEDGTFPRANQQSTGLLVPALRCRRPVQVLSSEYQKETPLAGYANGVFFWCGRWDLNPHVIDTRTSNVPVCRFQHFRKSHLTARKILAHLGV